MATKVAINGFGRIGRLFFKLAMENPNLEVVAINDLGDVDNMVYLLKYDSAQKDHGMDVSAKKVSDTENYFVVNGKEIPYFAIKEPAELPWGRLNVDVVVECTGFFTSFEKANAHIVAGAKRVVISGPTKDKQGTEFGDGKKGATVLMGLNEDLLDTCAITSNASCTTNASGTPLKVMMDTVGVEKALLNTVHSYTATQSLVDGPVKGDKDYRRGRAAAMNIVPASTGAAIAVTLAIPELEGKFDGVSLRVPTISGSIADITFIAKRDTSAEEINNIFRAAAQEERYKGLLRVEEDQVVSGDIIGDSHVAIVDLNFTKVIGNLVKLTVWYDNEAGYSNAMVRQVERIGKTL